MSTIAQRMNARLSPGINITHSTSTTSSVQTVVEDGYFQLVADLGFKSVRLPMYWQNYTTGGVINESYFTLADNAIQAGLDAGLIVIIDFHDYSAMMSDPEGELGTFLDLWSQVATHYKDWSDDLIFEILNEPSSNLKYDIWNEIYPQALSVIRETNKYRVVTLATAYYNAFSYVKYFESIKDESLIITIHYYQPMSVTHQGASWVDGADDWIGTTWEMNDSQQAQIGHHFSWLKLWQRSNNMIPIQIGEFGVYGAYVDSETRRLWTYFIRRQCEMNDFSWCYWEFYEGYGIWDPDTDTYNTEIIDALLSNTGVKNVKVETTNEEYTVIENSEGKKVARIRAVDGAHLVAISDVIPGISYPAAMILTPSNDAKWIEVPEGSKVYVLLNSTTQTDGVVQFTICDE